MADPRETGAGVRINLSEHGAQGLAETLVRNAVEATAAAFCRIGQQKDEGDGRVELFFQGRSFDRTADPKQMVLTADDVRDYLHRAREVVVGNRGESLEDIFEQFEQYIDIFLLHGLRMQLNFFFGRSPGLAQANQGVIDSVLRELNVKDGYEGALDQIHERLEAYQLLIFGTSYMGLGSQFAESLHQFSVGLAQAMVQAAESGNVMAMLNQLTAPQIVKALGAGGEIAAVESNGSMVLADDDLELLMAQIAQNPAGIAGLQLALLDDDSVQRVVAAIESETGGELPEWMKVYLDVIHKDSTSG